MKKILLILCLALFNISKSQTMFDKGYKVGYKKGYCYQKEVNCIVPLLPMTPMPNNGESSSSYEDGYNRGFIDGNKKSSANGSQESSAYNRKSYSRETEKFTPDYNYLKNNLNALNSNNVGNNSNDDNMDMLIAKAKDYYSEDHYNKAQNIYESLFKEYNSYKNKLKNLPNGTYAIILVSWNESNKVHDVYFQATATIKDNSLLVIDFYEYFTQEHKVLLNSSYPLQGLPMEIRITNVNIQEGFGMFLTNTYSYNKIFPPTSNLKYSFWFMQATRVINLK